MTANPTTAATSAANQVRKRREDGSLSPATLREDARRALRIAETCGRPEVFGYVELAEALEGEARQLEEGAS